jgi:hypothetical protein
MSSSLISRLREGRNIPLGEPWELVNEAADRIEDLEMALEAFLALEELSVSKDKYQSLIDALTRAHELMGKKVEWRNDN